MLLPAAAGAVEVDLGLKTEAAYDSNVFRSGDNEKGDGSFRFTPSIGVESQNSNWGVDLYYAPTYEVFTTYTDANALTHYLTNSFDYSPGEKTSLGLSQSFRLTEVLNYGDPDTIDEGTQPIPDNDVARDQVIMYDTSLNITHYITPKWVSNSDITFDLFDTDRRNSVNSRTVSAFQSFNYAINAANKVGGGGGVVVQMFDEVDTLPASNTYIYRLFGTYQRNFGERTTLSIQLGPALITTDQEDAAGTIQASQVQYPFLLVNGNTTVDGLDALLGEQEDVGRINFPVGLPDSTPVLAGSVIIPDAGECLGSITPPVLFEGNRCTKQRLLRIDHPEDAGLLPGQTAEMAALIDAIQLSRRDVEIAGSDKGSDDMTFSLFGEISLTQRWTPTLVSTLSYNRSESTASGQGASTIADTVSLLTTWRPSERWDFAISGTYVRRESPTDLSRTFLQVQGDDVGGLSAIQIVSLNGFASVVEESNSVDTERWGVGTRAAYRITRRMSVAARFNYSYQTSKHTSRNPNDFSDFTAVVGVKYDFDPFRF
jgi:hypothetical protein